MFAVLTALGLSVSAGLNAYLPLLAVGLLTKYTHVFELPAGWSWLNQDWVLILFGLLALAEFVADKVPAIDTFNDILQTVVRPSSGGVVFAVGIGSHTAPITNWDTFVQSPSFPSIIVGVVIALIPHLMKMLIRPVLNATTAGLATPLVSFGEDVISVALIALSIFLPILVPVAVVILLIIAVRVIKRIRNRAQAQTA
jgi:uncharacterized membrane protein